MEDVKPSVHSDIPAPVLEQRDLPRLSATCRICAGNVPASLYLHIAAIGNRISCSAFLSDVNISEDNPVGIPDISPFVRDDKTVLDHNI